LHLAVFQQIENLRIGDRPFVFDRSPEIVETGRVESLLSGETASGTTGADVDVSPGSGVADSGCTVCCSTIACSAVSLVVSEFAVVRASASPVLSGINAVAARSGEEYCGIRLKMLNLL